MSKTLCKASLHLPIQFQSRFYVALCALALPAPAELPLLLIEKVSLQKIILFSALGKAVGSMLLFTASSIFLRLGNHDAETFKLRVQNGRAGALLKGGKVEATYAVLQAIPFAPMRSATVALSIVASLNVRSLVVVAVGSSIGTISRMLIFAGLLHAGIRLFT
jgi:hypothetical protein